MGTLSKKSDISNKHYVNIEEEKKKVLDEIYQFKTSNESIILYICVCVSIH